MNDIKTVDIAVDLINTPWDERIHCATRKKTKNGIWCRKDDITNELYFTVIQKYRKAQLSANSKICVNLFTNGAEDNERKYKTI